MGEDSNQAVDAMTYRPDVHLVAEYWKGKYGELCQIHTKGLTDQNMDLKICIATVVNVPTYQVGNR